MNRNQNISVLHLALVLLGLVLGDSESDQGAGNSAKRAPCGRTTERGHDRACRDERSDARNCQASDPYQPAKCTRRESADNRAGRRALRRLGVMFVWEVPAAGAIRQ